MTLDGSAQNAKVSSPTPMLSLMFYTFPRRFVTETPGNRVRDTVSLTLDGSDQNGHAMKKKNGHAERTCHEKKKKKTRSYGLRLRACPRRHTDFSCRIFLFLFLLPLSFSSSSYFLSSSSSYFVLGIRQPLGGTPAPPRSSSIPMECRRAWYTSTTVGSRWGSTIELDLPPGRLLWR